MTLLSVSQSPRLLQAVTGPSRAAREAARGNRFCSLVKNLVSPGQTKEGKATDTGEKGENVEKRENTEKRENMEKRTRSVYSKKILSPSTTCLCNSTKADPCSFIYSMD